MLPDIANRTPNRIANRTPIPVARTNRTNEHKRSGPITAAFLPTAVDAHARMEIRSDTNAIRALMPNTTEEPT